MIRRLASVALASTLAAGGLAIGACGSTSGTTPTGCNPEDAVNDPCQTQPGTAATLIQAGGSGGSAGEAGAGGGAGEAGEGGGAGEAGAGGEAGEAGAGGDGGAGGDNG